jgi:hypothetical protein
VDRFFCTNEKIQFTIRKAHYQQQSNLVLVSRQRSVTVYLPITTKDMLSRQRAKPAFVRPAGRLMDRGTSIIVFTAEFYKFMYIIDKINSNTFKLNIVRENVMTKNCSEKFGAPAKWASSKRPERRSFPAWSPKWTTLLALSTAPSSSLNLCRLLRWNSPWLPPAPQHNI